MPVSNLRDLLPECDSRDANIIPYRDGCQWTTKLFTSAGPIDCVTDIVPCVQPLIDPLATALGNLTSTVAGLTTQVNTLNNNVSILM